MPRPTPRTEVGDHLTRHGVIFQVIRVLDRRQELHLRMTHPPYRERIITIAQIHDGPHGYQPVPP